MIDKANTAINTVSNLANISIPSFSPAPSTPPRSAQNSRHSKKDSSTYSSSIPDPESPINNNLGSIRIEPESRDLNDTNTDVSASGPIFVNRNSNTSLPGFGGSSSSASASGAESDISQTSTNTSTTRKKRTRNEATDGQGFGDTPEKRKEKASTGKQRTFRGSSDKVKKKLFNDTDKDDDESDYDDLDDNNDTQ